ncbi:MAG: UDP-N-acetylglucosamine 1-carboxyvinyltransferase [Candidatus Pacebacteria bacterium]|jgi:UDP-N-acetylglucosamine 1-carboxyvinyltransferase|nr:UDP-N-acetylglucosamine 1-carboxyvinyltransferase [Candidatus Paceibacterota bacterium]
MAKFLIRGGKKLEGKIKISGSKNAALPLISASLLISGRVILKNVPQISDVEVMLEILKILGAEIERDDSMVIINTKNLDYRDLLTPLISKLRASILLLAPILFRFGKIKMSLPGGDIIGARPITTHLEALRALGAEIEVKNGIIEGEFKKFKSFEVVLKEISVTASEVVLMASVFSPKPVKLKLLALEPHVVSLEKFIQKLGYKVKGLGTHFVTISRNKNIKKEIAFEVPYDYIEAATFLALASATRSNIIIENAPLEDLDSVFLTAKEMNVNFEIKKKTIVLKPSKLKGTKIQVGYHPKFPTDAQPPFGVLATQAEGVTLIHDWMYENRFSYLNELNLMGANTELLDPHRAIIIGTTPLYGKEVRSLDIRSGISLIIAGLVAQGETIIHEAEKIDRGYERIEEKLTKVGAEIYRISD